jgi:hypothetical protein
VQPKLVSDWVLKDSITEATGKIANNGQTSGKKKSKDF